ncbi:transketolase [Microbispora rosea subsp. aerata]|nr:transketolase C-terminal domain-containing protein [Microbispora rosea]GGO14475.1 transketolase [Microbispora rosea subsp. aerata]GIH55532.1 transketolase [Microbispora rosea subsp. aerata]GLJ86476.1 transketolase [Microbispora rosea subsp. aerata]
MKATRDWFGEALVEVAERYDDVVVVNCDLGSATKTHGFKKSFPERFYECGIAEANSIGVAAGLAQEGYRPFVASFGHFLSGKYLEIFQSVGLNDSGVVLVGTHAGLAIGKDGPTQMGLRDLALMRTIHNMRILHPADGIETRAMLYYIVENRCPIYLRLCRQPQREIHDPGYRFRFGWPDVVREGERIVLFTMGGMVEVLLDALDELSEHGIDPTIVNVSSLPVDRAAIARLARQHSYAFVVEDHFIKGGLADEIARIILDMEEKVRLGVWGVADYGQAGSPADLYERYQLNAHGVASRVREFLVTRN